MTTELAWPEIERLFGLAIAQNRDQRTAFLDQACSDPAMRGEVESLLIADEHARWFLDPARVTPRSQDTRIGPYRLIRKLGEGETSSVHLAVRDDNQYHQHVAIKVMRPGVDSQPILQRFHQERQILASLNHPHIARLLDGGSTASGQPYFIMEYVDGAPLDVHCRRNDLPLARRLELFCQICEAVQFAHRKLVVHRDLKPANILVDTEGAPRLLDFGIAKLLDPDRIGIRIERTATVARLMTPHYASPEQVQGKPVSTASDIYSLGIILYKLVTGRRPYELASQSLHEIERVVCEAKPPCPSRVGGARSGDRLPRDLDAIVLMAMRKEPERRYASAQTFADDVRRCLERRPVQARRGALGYRASSFVRRNVATLVAAAVMVVVSLLGGVGVAAWQWRPTRVPPRSGHDTVRGGAPVAGAPVAPAPVAHWRYDHLYDSVVVTDSSGNGAHGVKTPGVGRTTGGLLGSAWAFDGVSARVEVADRPAFHFTRAMTAAAWVRPSRLAGPQTIVNKWYAPDSYMLLLEDGSYRFSIALAGGSRRSISAPAAVDRWTHVAGVFDGTTMVLYIDGAAVASTSAAGALQDSAQPIEMGGHPTWNAYAGLLDDVRLYDVALSPQWVRHLAQHH